MNEKLHRQILWQIAQLILAISHILLLLSKKIFGVDVAMITAECENYGIDLQKRENGDY